MGAPPVPAKKNNTILIVVVVIVVVLALVIAGTLMVLNTFNHAVTSDISMTVTDTRTPASTEYTIAPTAGNTYVQVTVSMTNNGDMITAVSGIFFELQASGTKYSYTPQVTSDTYSATIPAGGTATFSVSFEIPLTASPQKILFTPILGHQVSANI